MNHSLSAKRRLLGKADIVALDLARDDDPKVVHLEPRHRLSVVVLDVMHPGAENGPGGHRGNPHHSGGEKQRDREDRWLLPSLGAVRPSHRVTYFQISPGTGPRPSREARESTRPSHRHRRPRQGPGAPGGTRHEITPGVGPDQATRTLSPTVSEATIARMPRVIR